MLIDSDAGQPLYRRISATLQSAIANGHYPTGSVLPTEIEISQQFGVCRQTVRDALRILSDAGLVRRRRRVGTVVIGSAHQASFIQPLQGHEALLQYARNARFMVARYACATPSRLTRALKLNPQEWILVEGVRGDGMRPVAFTTALIRQDCAPTHEALLGLTASVSELIEQSFGISVARIDQQITACALTKREAELLHAATASPALCMLRQYFDNRAQLYFVAQSTHPADRFAYSMSYTRITPEA